MPKKVRQRVIKEDIQCQTLVCKHNQTHTHTEIQIHIYIHKHACTQIEQTRQNAIKKIVLKHKEIVWVLDHVNGQKTSRRLSKHVSYLSALFLKFL